MGRELVVLILVFLLTLLYSFDRRGGMFSEEGGRQHRDSSAVVEIVRDGRGRVYPLDEVRHGFVILSGAPLAGGDRLEYGEDGRVGRGRMRGEALLLFGMPVSLNSATAEDLAALPGIGPGMAGAIIRFREENGPFLALSDLMKVRGIGKKRFESLEGMIEL